LRGLIKATEGDVMDHRATLDDILDIASQVELIEIAYDRYKMTEMIVGLQEANIELVPFGQGFASMNGAVDNLEVMVLSKEIEHFNNPVLRWMNSNVAITKDPAGNRKFNKAKSQDKIDGIVAMAMALQRGKVNQESRYSEWTEVRVI
jgi:phage terminase large subunit-like protein